MDNILKIMETKSSFFMRKLLIPLIAVLVLPNTVNAGIPQNKNVNKWMRVERTLMVDTEDVDVKKGKLRFFIKRNAAPGEYAGPNALRREYTGKLRINCDKFTSGIQVLINNAWGTYSTIKYSDIQPNEYAYTFANYFCFATGSEGYTRESYEPSWVKKIINSIEIRAVSYTHLTLPTICSV